MRTVPFKSILDWLARRMLGSEANLTQEFAGAYVDMINTAVRDGWEREFWPEWTLIEERQYRPTFDPFLTYSANIEVRYGDAYYRSISGVTADQPEPPANPTQWAECGVGSAAPLDPYIALTQFRQLPIGTPRALTEQDPRQRAGTRAVAFSLGPNGVQVQVSARQLASVWLEYRLPPPVFTSAVYSSATAYLAGARVYLPAAGECYLALDTSTDVTPGSDPDTWQLIEFPYVLAEFVKMAAYAEALRDDGQHDKASVQHDFAEDELGTEWSKAESQIGAVRTFHVLSRPAPTNSHSYAC